MRVIGQTTKRFWLASFRVIFLKLAVFGWQVVFAAISRDYTVRLCGR
jgi:hypothetical protein